MTPEDLYRYYYVKDGADHKIFARSKKALLDEVFESAEFDAFDEDDPPARYSLFRKKRDGSWVCWGYINVSNNSFVTVPTAEYDEAS